MTPIGAVHTVLAFSAIIAGGVVLSLPKGTRWHRTFGHAYVTAMVGVVVTSLVLRDLTGGFGPFHLAAVVAGAIASTPEAMRRERRRLEQLGRPPAIADQEAGAAPGARAGG